MGNKGQTNRLLGYPVDARLLIINADDFGMCNAVNEAIIQTLTAGVVRSTSLMVPCPWAIQAMHFLASHPEIPFGVHLTIICDSDDYSWDPVTCKDKVPSLAIKPAIPPPGPFPGISGSSRIGSTENGIQGANRERAGSQSQTYPPGLALSPTQRQGRYY
jgi:hypothetical protein